MALGPPHVLKLWLGVSKGMLPVKYFLSIKAFFVLVEFHGDHKTVAMMRYNLAILSIGDIKIKRHSFNLKVRVQLLVMSEC